VDQVRRGTVVLVADDRPASLEPPAKTPVPNRRGPRARVRLRTELNREESWRPRWLWALFALPGGVWLVGLFVLPFYAVLSVAAGALNPVFETPVPVWNPLEWSWANFAATWHEVVGKLSFLGPPLLRTVIYTALASIICLLIAYPVAYFVARFAGPRKTLFLVLLIAPFWVSYMMRMLAWIDLLQTNGYVNRALSGLHLMNGSHPVNWLGGKSITVVLGLVYGYIPYLVIVLYAGLDRIDGHFLEAARDLGLNRVQTFIRVTLPLSRPTILAGMLITVLPMIGDYFTNQLLSASPSTTMVGNAIEGQLNVSDLEGQGAALSIALLVVLLLPLLYYVRTTAKASAERG
jgi:ABC-type spermidine/putrescine transport system permease subunit I